MKKWIFRILTVLVLVAISAVMMIIGRGHTVYFDNKTLETENGSSYSAYHKVEVYVNGERVAKLGKRDRGMTTWMGQNFKMELVIVEKQGDAEKKVTVSQKLPYNLDGIVLNIPGLLAGLSQNEYLTEFVPLVQKEEVEENIVIDEFAIPTDESGSTEESEDTQAE